jgi:hypothetical protein
VLVAIAAGGLLRAWELDRPDLTFDEAFTYTRARLPLDAIPDSLRATDAHPPLDYLVRHPVAVGDATAARLRLPSVLFSLAAVVVTAVWLRRDRWLGVGVTALMAVAPFQVEFGRDARMYATTVLLGTSAAWVATRWLERPSPRRASVAGVIVLLALWTHVSGLFLGAGLLAIAGLRRDAPAWVWRGALAAAGLVWAVTWGPAFLHQAEQTTGGWIPYTTPTGLARAVNELVTSYRGVAWVGLAAVTAGGALVVRRAEPALRRVWLCCFLLPTVLVALVGIRMHVLLPRTLAFASWGAPVALVHLVDAARRRWVPLGVAVGALVALLVVPSLVAAPWRDPQGHERAFAYVADRARPADAVAVHPAWLWPLVDWRMRATDAPAPRRQTMPTSLYATAMTRRATWTGRVWLIYPATYAADTAGFRPCGPTIPAGAYRVRCLDAAG